MTSRREILALAAVLDVALHARGVPVSAKALALRLDLAPRHLETLLRDLVQARILKPTRGPRGGYELARERRRISVGDVLRAAADARVEVAPERHVSRLVETVVIPTIADAQRSFLAALDRISIEDMARQAERQATVEAGADPGAFVI
jgi:Rrf2 family transcriptional regulator, iron-sulfur cluster assembly transcription factor